jgi:hypothetical protein
MAKMYKNWTIHERMANFLTINFQAEEVPSRNAYTIYKGVVRDQVKYFLLGSNGAVRVNNRPAALGAISKTEYFKKALATFEAEQGLV